MARYLIPFCLVWGLWDIGTPPGFAQTRPAEKPNPQRKISAPGERPTGSPARNQSPKLVQAPPAGTPQQPPGFPLPPDKQKRVDDILAFWEQRTSAIKTFQCEYRREEFDPVMGPRDRAEKIVTGIIKYAAPDKGLMEDKKVKGYAPPEQEGDPTYRFLPNEFGQYWLCDGASAYVKDFRTKVLTETKLPPELRGKTIAEGPLPFVFGAKADTMRRRFWIREVTPQDNPDGEYFLEVIPKLRDDAANYEKIVIILDSKTKDQLLPRAMRITIRGNGRHDDYHFEIETRRVNDTRDRVAGYFQAFVKPDVPADWKREVRDWNMNPIHIPVANQKDGNSSQAKRPEIQKRR